MNKVSKCFVLLFCLVSVWYMMLAYWENKVYVESKRDYAELRNLVIEKQKEEERVDFERLRKINPDICAWILIPGTSIDYPVLIGKDNAEYLDKNFRGEYDKLGSVFAFSDTNREFKDAHTCIFAHNMKRPQMFGELKKYKTSQFAREYQVLYLYTPGNIEEYRLFSVLECEKTDGLFRHRIERGSKEFYKLIRDIRDRNEQTDVDEGNDIEEVEKLLTLSTCSEYERTKNRMTVHFVKI